MARMIELRSDADTLPTDAMREAMARAPVGDDILGEDPSTNELQAVAASLFGKDAALLTISGTMSNQVAVMALTQRGDEVIVGRDAHLYNMEVAGLTTLSQVQPRAIDAPHGQYDLDQMRSALRSSSIQSAATGLICLENTYNLNAGDVCSLDNMIGVRRLARAHGVPVYLDGARVFNAAAALGVPLSALAEQVDVLQICLTKGLGCPLGSLLLGSRAFIEKAKRIRQRLGGGMRQSGVIAAAGLVGLQTMREHMHADHAHARLLAKGLAALPGIGLLTPEPQSNIVAIELATRNPGLDDLIEQLKARHVLIKKIGERQARMVTHFQVDTADVEYVLKSFRDILAPRLA